MDESDRLSTAAIAIALIALIIPFGQFIQQLLGTADGYRRCKRSVIGPWSKLTHRHWLWSEFRYETLYTTPEIALIPWVDLKSKDMLDRSRKLGMVEPIVRNDGLVNDLTNLERKLGPSYRKSFWAYGYTTAFWAYLTSTLTCILTLKRERQPKVDDAENGSQIGIPTQPYISQRRKRQSEAVEKTVCAKDDQLADQELLVNWVPFLQALHRDHIQQWPGECKCSPAADREAWTKSFQGQANKSDRSMPMLFLRERSWDFMPPDVVRPVASIQVRALIVFATRLGMQWSGLDLKTEGGMSAQGNSFYLTSVSLRGLGTVMQFGSDGHTARELGYIPSRAADKLLCGILPGNCDLCPEVKIVGDDRTQSLIGNLFEVLGLPEDIRQGFAIPEYRNRLAFRAHVYKRMMINDAMILFCPFLPPIMCTSVYCYFYAWAGQNQMSTFHLWESRRALLVQLRKRIETLKELLKYHDLSFVEKCLGQLEKDYQADFYSQHNASLTLYEHDEERGLSEEGGLSGVEGRRKQYRRGPLLSPDTERAAIEQGDLRRLREQRRKFLSCLRGIFWETQMFFDWLQTNKIPDHHIKYVDLVSANIELCYFAGEEARKRWEAGNAKHVPDFGVRPGEGFLECYEAASCYVEFLDHNEHGLFASLRRKGCEMENMKMEEAWWMLMLRGIVWDMSCNCQNPGAPIPSSFYYVKRPVWMM